MLPTREEALKLIRDGLLFNPGPWGEHCLTAAHCAEKIASACGDMDVEKAYILGLLHDIGRKFDVTDEELIIIKTELAKTIYDEYDRLIREVERQRWLRNYKRNLVTIQCSFRKMKSEGIYCGLKMA